MLFQHFPIQSTWAPPYPLYQVQPLVEEIPLIEPPTLHSLLPLTTSLKPREVGVEDFQVMGLLAVLLLLGLLVWLVPQALLLPHHLSMVSTWVCSVRSTGLLLELTEHLHLVEECSLVQGPQLLVLILWEQWEPWAQFPLDLS